MTSKETPASLSLPLPPSVPLDPVDAEARDHKVALQPLHDLSLDAPQRRALAACVHTALVSA